MVASHGPQAAPSGTQLDLNGMTADPAVPKGIDLRLYSNARPLVRYFGNEFGADRFESGILLGRARELAEWLPASEQVTPYLAGQEVPASKALELAAIKRVQLWNWGVPVNEEMAREMVPIVRRGGDLQRRSIEIGDILGLRNLEGFQYVRAALEAFVNRLSEDMSVESPPPRVSEESKAALANVLPALERAARGELD